MYKSYNLQHDYISPTFEMTLLPYMMTNAWHHDPHWPRPLYIGWPSLLAGSLYLVLEQLHLVCAEAHDVHLFHFVHDAICNARLPRFFCHCNHTLESSWFTSVLQLQQWLLSFSPSFDNYIFWVSLFFISLHSCIPIFHIIIHL